MQNPQVLVIIPARGGSKRIRFKNTRPFCGVPLIVRTIRQAKKISFASRIIVDTDDAAIAALAKRAGAEVPFLRPKKLAADKSLIVDAVIYLLSRLEKEEDYNPKYVLLLQTTSPLREMEDITASWKLMQKGGANSVVTVAPTHPRLYSMDSAGFIHLENGSETMSSNMQEWPAGYLLNGCFLYLTKTAALKKERRFITSKTKAVVCPKWRSVDLDSPEEWVMGEMLFRNKTKISKALGRFT